jgi:hypothetical protein
MKGNTIKLSLERSDYGVVGQDSIVDVFSTIVDITVPSGVDYILYNHTPFVIKLADGSNEALGRNGEIIIGKRGPGDTLVKELYRWDYGIFYALSVVQQRTMDYRDQVSLTMSWPYAICLGNEHLILQVKHATVCDISQVANLIEFKVNRVAKIQGLAL